jgi:hypothetical protein
MLDEVAHAKAAREALLAAEAEKKRAIENEKLEKMK